MITRTDWLCFGAVLVILIIAGLCIAATFTHCR